MRFFLLQRGFTLTEIIVVVAIITLLTSAGGLVAYQGSRERARDTQRMNDLERIALAAESYRQEYGMYPECPNGITVEVGGAPRSSSPGGCAAGAAFLNYIQTMFGEIPHDPLGPGSDDYYYYYEQDHQCADADSGESTAVTVFAANMERTPSNLLTVCDSVVNNDGGWRNTTAYGGTKNPSQTYALVLVRSR